MPWQKFPQNKKSYLYIKVIPTDQLVIRDADDSENYEDMYEEEKEEMRKISTRSKLLKEIPLITKAQKFAKVLQHIMDDFLNKQWF